MWLNFFSLSKTYVLFLWLSIKGLITRDVPNFPPRLKELRSQLVSFMEEEVLPEEETFALHQRSEGKWRPHPKLEDLKVMHVTYTCVPLEALLYYVASKLP